MLGETALDRWMTRGILQCSSAYDMVRYGAPSMTLSCESSTVVACNIILTQLLTGVKVERFELERLFGDNGNEELDMRWNARTNSHFTVHHRDLPSQVRHILYRIELVYISSCCSLFALQPRPGL